VFGGLVECDARRSEGFLTDDVARAYAILGLQPGSSLAEVRRRYRYLVRHWHPDRYVADTRSQAEAADTMGRINAAYERIADHLAPVRPNQREPMAGTPSAARLSRDQLDRMVKAIGSEGPLDHLLGAFGWVGSAFYGLLSILFLAACAVRVVVLLWRGDVAGIVRDPELLVALLLLVVFLTHEFLVRRRIIQASAGSSSRG
jgi:hypothetical protein